MENYRNFKKIKTKSMFGNLDLLIPFGTVCSTNGDDLIIYTLPDPKPNESATTAVCYNKSQTAYDYFLPVFENESIDDWLDRAKYYNAIKDITSGPSDARKEACYDAIWHDEVANKYRQINDDVDETMWIWDFYKLHHATLNDLKSIWDKVKNIIY